MGSIITPIASIIIPLMFGVLVVTIIKLIFRLIKKKWLSMKATLIICIVTSVTFSVSVTVFVNAMTYRAEESVDQYLVSGETVTVTDENGNLFFDGPGTESAVIFFPGAFVETKAYAQLSYMIAESGSDVFLVDMPLRIAPLGAGKAGGIIHNHSYSKWYMCGHSLGGAAASFICSRPDLDINGMIFLASYSMGPMSDEIPVLSVYGSEDGVINFESYNKSKATFREDNTEVVIEGGNHAGFGSYGHQKGDNEATVSPDEQKRVTAAAIEKFISAT